MVGLNSVVNEKNNAQNASSNDKVTRQIFVTGGVASSLGNGLSEILIGQGDITTAAKPTSIAKFDLIPRGQVPPNPSELLMSERFAELVNWASKNYDLVLIDTPPILAVTDAAIVGRHVGTTLMVARYAVNTLKEVETSLSRFEQNGIPVKGVILNSIFRRASAYQDYGYYEYEYKSDAK